jgi:potassium-transporting ATPase KdpC subunit
MANGLRKDLTTAAIAIVAITIVLGLAYPLAITGLSQVFFSGPANGSKVSLNGKVVGSHLIGQEFTEPVIGKNGKPVKNEEGEVETQPNPNYFQPRPSATGYSGNVTFFGNEGPNSVETREEIREELKEYVQLNKPYDKSLTREQVPVDAVTQSASGVDPDISEANAAIQAHRIAAVRGLPLAKVEELISQNTDNRSLGVLGEPGVNVLEVNISLEEEAPLK